MNDQGRRNGHINTFELSEIEVVKKPTIKAREEPSQVSRYPLVLHPPQWHGSVTVSMPEVY